MLDHRMVIGGIVAPHAHGVLLLQQVHLEHPVVLIPLKMAPKESKPIGHKNCVKQFSFPETQHNYEHNTTSIFFLAQMPQILEVVKKVLWAIP